MSRIGKQPIPLPEKVEISVDKKSNVVTVKGPKGTLTQAIDPDISISIEENVLTVTRPTEQKRHKALHGLYRALIANMVKGVSDGFKIDLELVGVGFKSALQGTSNLELSLGFSHNLVIGLPPEIKVSTITEKGKNPIVTLEGIDKHLIGQVAAKLRSLREVEPYKGKGIRFVGEVVRRKAGKTSAK